MTDHATETGQGPHSSEWMICIDKSQYEALNATIAAQTQRIADLTAERAAPQAVPAAEGMPDEVAETLRVALEYYLFEMEHVFVYDEATDKSRRGDTEAIAAHDVALAWLTKRPRPAADAPG